jgi:hypothetical protein
MTYPAAFTGAHPNVLKLRPLSLRQSILWACACVAGIVAMLGPAAAAEKNIGAASRVVHLVTGALAPTEPPTVLRVGIDVFANEIVKTGENSAALLVFQDKTELSVGADSEIVLDRFVFDPDPAKSAVAISVLTGVARFSTGLLPKSAYTIRTPTATLSVRGTTLTVTVEKGQPAGQPEKRRRGGTCGDPLARKTQVDVITGAVALSAQSETVLIDTGQSSTVECGSPPTAPFSSPAPSLALAQMDTLLQQAALQTNPATGFGNALQNLGAPPGATTSGSVGTTTGNCVSCSHLPP